MRNAFWILPFLFLLFAVPATGQEVIFEDDFEADSGLWFNEPDAPAWDQRAVDPLDPTNQAVAPEGQCGIWFLNITSWSAPIPVDMASSYTLSFRFLDESPNIQSGRVALRFDPEGPEEYVMPFQLVADGSWHEYSFEFVPGELFNSESDHITICLVGWRCCRLPGEGHFYDICEGETLVYYDDFLIETTGSVSNETTSWSRVKSLFR